LIILFVELLRRVVGKKEFAKMQSSYPTISFSFLVFARCVCNAHSKSKTNQLRSPDRPKLKQQPSRPSLFELSYTHGILLWSRKEKEEERKRAKAAV